MLERQPDGEMGWVGETFPSPEEAKQWAVPSTTASRTEHSKKAFRTAEGHTIDEEAYMARLALAFADDRDEVLDAVRVTHEAKQAFWSDRPDDTDLLTGHREKAIEMVEEDLLSDHRDEAHDLLADRFGFR